VAITEDTLQLLANLRVVVNDHVTTATDDLVAAWARGWSEIEAAWAAAVSEVVDLIDDGRWPTRTQIDRVSRLRQALSVSLQQIDRLADAGAVTVQDTAGRVVDLTPDWQARIVGSQLPDGYEQLLGVSFDRLDPEALRAIVLRTTEQIASAYLPLSDAAVEAMYGALVRGVAAGENPRQVAARMLARVQGAFNGGLARALNIARTEILDAHRAAAEANHNANAAVLGAWMWLCSLSVRTCPSCLAKHGTTHPLSEPGPIDHQQGRCARMPVAKSWRDLGFDIPEPPSIVPDARAWFDGLSRGEQLRIMGRGRLDAYLGGELGWDDMSVLRSTPGWRDSVGVRPLADALR
jgi:hypothetical protein